MELKIASAGEWRPAALGGSSGVHKDILEGRDCEIGWEDVYTGESDLRTWSAICCSAHTLNSLTQLVAGSELRQIPDFHTEIETKMKMNW